MKQEFTYSARPAGQVNPRILLLTLPSLMLEYHCMPVHLNMIYIYISWLMIKLWSSCLWCGKLFTNWTIVLAPNSKFLRLPLVKQMDIIQSPICILAWNSIPTVKNNCILLGEHSLVYVIAYSIFTMVWLLSCCTCFSAYHETSEWFSWQLGFEGFEWHFRLLCLN